MRAVAIPLAMLAACLSAGVSGAAPASDRKEIRVFESAERLLSDSRTPPGDSADWRPVSLPDELRRTAPNAKGRAWYRIRFQLPEIPRGPQSVLLLHLRAHNLEFHVNGVRLGDVADWSARRTGPLGLPIRVTIPPALLRTGQNELAIRFIGTSTPTQMHGLGRIRMGDAAVVRAMEVLPQEIASNSYRYLMAAMLAVGLIALLLWIVRRDDKVIFWFAVACLLWGTANVLRYTFREAVDPLLIWMNFNVVRYGLVPPTFVMCLRIAGRRWPRVELGVWAFFAFVVLFPAFGLHEGMPAIYFGLPLANASLLVAGAAVILRFAPRPLRWSHRLEVAAVIAMALLLCHELARYFGWIDVEAHVLRHFHVPVMLIAMGAAILERHVGAVWRVEQSNVELERRVAEKSRELEAHNARVEESKREQALARERQRIMADMHDGVGASLIGLLRHVQSGTARPTTIEQRVQEALQEMRIAVDALQPREGDLASVLGSLRYRLDAMIEATGVRLRWDVAELPAVRNLTPVVVFGIQRILLEAISNALKHSGARNLHVAASALEPDQIEIRIEDDGCGFDPLAPVAGQGVRNMRARAERMGARLHLERGPAGGTCVRLLLPRVMKDESTAQRSESGLPEERSNPSSAARLTAAGPERTASLR